jgi:hypothetical protein
LRPINLAQATLSQGHGLLSSVTLVPDQMNTVITECQGGHCSIERFVQLHSQRVEHEEVFLYSACDSPKQISNATLEVYIPDFSVLQS